MDAEHKQLPISLWLKIGVTVNTPTTLLLIRSQWCGSQLCHLSEDIWREGRDRESLLVNREILFILVFWSLFWDLAWGGDSSPPHPSDEKLGGTKKKNKNWKDQREREKRKKNEAQTASQAGLQVELSTFSFLAQCSMTTRWDEQQRLVWAAASWVGNSKHWGPSVYMLTDVYGSHLSDCSPAAAGPSGLLPFSRRPNNGSQFFSLCHPEWLIWLSPELSLCWVGV